MSGVAHQTMGPDVEPMPARTLQLAAPDRSVSDAGRTVWPRCGHVLRTGLAVLYGRTVTTPAELREAAAAALAMADLLEAVDEDGH